MTHRDGPAGIGGWLLLFLILIGLVMPLIFAANLWASQDAAVAEHLGPQRMRALMTFDASLLALRILLSWYVVLRLVFVRRWQSVRIAIAFLWLGLPLLLLVQAGLGHVFNWAAFDEMLVYSISEAKPLLWLATGVVWTAYLLRSKRVARTYARPGFAAASAADTVQVFE